MPRVEKRYKGPSPPGSSDTDRSTDIARCHQRVGWGDLLRAFMCARTAYRRSGEKLATGIERVIRRMSDVVPTTTSVHEHMNELVEIHNRVESWRNTVDGACVRYLWKTSSMMDRADLPELQVECRFRAEAVAGREGRGKTGKATPPNLDIEHTKSSIQTGSYTIDHACRALNHLYEIELECIRVGMSMMERAINNRSLSVSPWATVPECMAIRQVLTNI